jgi:hypothetical protein
MPRADHPDVAGRQAPKLRLASSTQTDGLANSPTTTRAFSFNGAVSRRYGYEIAGIIAIKLPLLLLLWLVVIRPWPHDPANAALSVARSYSISSRVAPHD